MTPAQIKKVYTMPDVKNPTLVSAEEVKIMMEENNKMLWDILQDLKEIKEIYGKKLL
jgi:hypothetical protein